MDSQTIKEVEEVTEFGDQFNLSHLEEGFGIEGDDFDMEETYIEKLKIQRKRIEQLTRLYSENEKKLGNQVEFTKSLEEKLKSLEHYRDNEGKYESLKANYDALSHDYHEKQREVEALKDQINRLIHQRGQHVNRLKTEMHTLRESRHQELEGLKDKLQDKEQQLSNIQKVSKRKQIQLQKEISGLKDQIGKLRKDNEDKNNHRETIIHDLKLTTNKDKDRIGHLQSNIKHISHENNQLTNANQRLAMGLQTKQRQFEKIRDRLKQQVADLKRQLKERESGDQQIKSQLKERIRENQSLKDQIESLKEELRRIKQIYESNMTQLQNSANQNKHRLQSLLDEHRESIKELLRMKDQLLAENKRITAILKKKELYEKQRRNLLKCQFRQIDKLEKAVDRIVE